jgi:predicted dehydrogenase
MPSSIRLGVFGAGHLGKIHLKCALAAQNIELVGFYDPDDKNAESAIQQFQVNRYATPEALLAEIDAVDIVTPTVTHFDLAQKAIQAGKHLFIEKPVTETVEEGKALMEMTAASLLKVQIGHVERFNPAFTALQGISLSPMFIESHRLAAFQPRGTDVSVVLDLMIHDLDLTLHLINSPVTNVSASGVAVLSTTPDIANARLEFANGAVANLTASRISMKQMRKMRLFQPNAYISLDFLEKNAQIVRLFAQDDPALPPVDNLMAFETPSGKKWLQLQMPASEPVNAIQKELETFAESILTDTPTRVPLKDGFAALEVAHRILHEMEERRKMAHLI